MFDARDRLGESRDRAELIRHFVQVAAAPIQKGGGDLARQAQHRLVGTPGREQTGTGVEDARTRHHRADRRAPGGTGVTERHVTAGLLVARADGAHLGLRPMQGIEQAVGLCTGQTEHGIHAVCDQRINECFTTGTVAGYGTHCGTVSSTRITPNSAPHSRTANERNESRAPISRFSGARI